MRCKKICVFGLMLFVLSCATGCAVGNKYDYASCSLPVPCKGSGLIAITVHDQRPFVRAGDKSPDFVGLQRGGYGNPFDVRTSSHRPLADDMTEVLTRWLTQSGFEVKNTSVSHVDNAEKVKSELLGAGADKSILLTVRQWKTDTYVNVKLLYELELVVYNASGNVLAQSSAHGENNIGGSFVNPPSYAHKAAPLALSEKLETLLSDAKVKKALALGAVE